MQTGQVVKVDGARTDVIDITQYAYDVQGNLAKVTDALGHVTKITSYDANGRPLLSLTRIIYKSPWLTTCAVVSLLAHSY